MSRRHNLGFRLERLQENAPKPPMSRTERFLKILAIKYEERGWGPLPPDRTPEWVEEQIAKIQAKREGRAM